MALALTAFATTAMLAFLSNLIPDAPAFALGGVRVLSSLCLATLVVTAAACLYRYAPSPPRAKWVWLSPGALIATLSWLIATAAFSVYASRFGDYNATYGSLGAVILLLTWLWLSAYVFLIGAELNGELERQTSAPVLENPQETAATDSGIEGTKQDGFANVQPEQGSAATSASFHPSATNVPGASASKPGTMGLVIPLKIGARLGGAKLGLPAS